MKYLISLIAAFAFYATMAMLFGKCTETVPTPPSQAIQRPAEPSGPTVCAAPPSIEKSKRAVGQPGAYWPKGSTISVGFLSGTAEQKAFARRGFETWAKKCAIKFAFFSLPEATKADVRVGFARGGGSWSYIGTDALRIGGAQPTMNLGWIDDDIAQKDYSTVEHEAGHALGLLHEHQNPSGGIRWNEAAVIDALSKPPNNWTVEQIKRNVLSVAPKGSQYTVFDQKSVMLYWFPAAWTTDGRGTDQNCCVSATDSAFVAGIYGPAASAARADSLPLFTLVWDERELSTFPRPVLDRAARRKGIDAARFSTRKKLAAELWKKR